MNHSDPLTLAEVHAEHARLLEQLHALCTAHQIRYFLAYGSLLGAVREGAPILWDDDADIWMPRPDFEKLLALRHEFEDAVLSRPGDPDFHWPFPKLVSTRTRADEPGVRVPSWYGLFVDIFPIDGTPATLSGAHRGLLRLLTRAHQWGFTEVRPSGGRVTPRILAKRTVGGLARLLPERIWIRMITAAATLTAYQDDSLSVSSLVARPQLFGPGAFRGYRMSRFGSLQLRIPLQAGPVLESIYGDSWHIPTQWAGHIEAHIYWR